MNCKSCNRTFKKKTANHVYCSELCQRYYFYHSEEHQAYLKKYYSRPDVMKKAAEHRRKYNLKPSSQKWRKTRDRIDRELGLTKDCVFVSDFFMAYNRNPKWRKEDPETIISSFAENACNLGRKQKCRIEEKIHVKLHEKRLQEERDRLAREKEQRKLMKRIFGVKE